MKKYTVVVAGLGKRGKHHCSAFYNNPRFDLIGVCDIDVNKLQEVKKEFNVPEADTNVVALLQKVKPDIFCFCTMPNLRLEMIQYAVESKVKLIAFEKPMALSYEEGYQIYKLIKDNKIKAVISHQHRYGEHYSQVKKIISNGNIGRIHTVYATSTGWMTHMLSHLIDYICWYNDYTDAEWVIAQASGTRKFADNHPSADYIAGFIHFKNGVHGVIECGAGAPDVPEVEYWWGKCRIGAQGTEGFAEVLTRGGWRAVTKKGIMSGTGSMNYDHDTPLYVEDIVKWLDDDNQIHPCNIEYAFKGFEIAMGLIRSVINRGQIKLPLEYIPGYKELVELKKVLDGTPTIPTTQETAKQYNV